MLLDGYVTNFSEGKWSFVAGQEITATATVNLYTLSDGSYSKALSFEGSGTQIVHLKIPQNVTVKSATLSLTGAPLYSGSGIVYAENLTYINSSGNFHRYNTTSNIYSVSHIYAYCGGNEPANITNFMQITQQQYDNSSLINTTGAFFILNKTKVAQDIFCAKPASQNKF